MVLEKEVMMKITNLTKPLYEQKGYSCDIGDILAIKIKDLGKGCKQKITIECDVCHKSRKQITVCALQRSKCYKNGKYICDSCLENIMKNRKCEICGSTKGVSNYLNKGILLCNRHKQQMRKHGEINRNREDTNKIRIFDDYAEFDTYDKNCSVNGTFKIDLDMIDFVKTHKFHKHHDGYACFKFKDKNGKTKNMRLHRYIMGIAFDKTKKNDVVDHINRDKSDNRKCNLRITTFETNNRNTGMYSHNISGYKGISRLKTTGKWEVYIHQHNKKICLGSYSDLKKAIQVREIAEIIYFGQASPRYNELIKKYINNTQVQQILLGKGGNVIW